MMYALTRLLIIFCIFAASSSDTSVPAATPDACECEKYSNRTLDCLGRMCTVVPEQYGWDTIEVAILRDNRIVNVSLPRSDTLKILDLTNNSIKSLDVQSFQPAPNLVSLLLGGNQLTTECLNVEAIWDSKKLEHLSLASNRIGDLDQPNIFINLRTSLSILNLSRNNINKIANNALTDLAALKDLDLSCNRISSLVPANLMGLRSLLNLNLSGNSLREIPANLIGGCNLIATLDLSHNSINEIHADAFYQAASTLENLFLHYNSITTISTQVLALNSLKYIILDYNPIFQIDGPAPFGPSLLDLSIRFCNRLKQLPDGLLQNSPLVERIDISNNKRLQTLGDFTFGETALSKVKFLNLANNSLGSLSPTVYRWNNSTVTNLEGNYWFCDCNLAWTYNYNFVDQIVCAMPLHYKFDKLLDHTLATLPCTFPERHRVEGAIFVALGFTTIFVAFLACLVRRHGRQLRRIVGDTKVGRYETLYNHRETAASTMADSTDSEVIRFKDAEDGVRDLGEEV